MELVQRQTQQLTQQTLQSLALLQMSTVELEAYVQELAQENPIIDLEPPRSEQEAPRDQELFRRVKWLEDSDRQNRYYQRLDGPAGPGGDGWRSGGIPLQFSLPPDPAARSG